MIFESNPVTLGAHYLALKGVKKKVIDYLFYLYKKHKGNELYPKVSTIAHACCCSERIVQKFIKENRLLNGWFFKVNKRFDTRGQSSNQYLLNKDLITAIEWLDIYGYRRSPQKKHAAIISSMEKQFKVHPAQPKKFTPLSRDSSFREDKDSKASPSASLHPMVRDLGIDNRAKMFATRYASTREIVEALQTCKYQNKQKKIINPSAYFTKVLREYINEYRGK